MPMNKNVKLASCTAVGVIIIALTILIFLLGVTEKTSLDRASFVFILISEIILFAVTAYITVKHSRSDKTIIRSGIVTTLSAYWALTVLIALFRNIFENHINTFIIVNCIVIALAAVVSILLNTAALNISSSDNKN